MPVRRIINFAVLIALWLASVFPAKAQTGPTEYQLKAAFLYNFAKFIDWPLQSFPSEKSPFVIGVLGQNPFGNFLERTVTDKEVNGHPISVQAFKTVAEASKCHLLFICSSEKENIPEIIKTLAGISILTVSETGQFTDSGGMVNFVEEAKKIRFQINEEAAKAVGLKMSSKLLSLALPSSR